MRSSANKVIEFRQIRKPNPDSGVCSEERVAILRAITEADNIRRYIHNPNLTDQQRKEMGLFKRPATVIAACDTIGHICEKLRRMDAIMLTHPYDPIQDDRIRVLASQMQEAIKVPDWYGVPVEYVDAMRRAAIKIVRVAGDRQQAWHIQRLREEARAKAERKGWDAD